MHLNINQIFNQYYINKVKQNSFGDICCLQLNNVKDLDKHKQYHCHLNATDTNRNSNSQKNGIDMNKKSLTLVELVILKKHM